MYNLLGQGCACGLQNTRLLRDCLRQESDLTRALERYSQGAVPEGHAITDLNLIGHLPGQNPLSKRHQIRLARAMAWQKIRGTDLRGRVGRADVSYAQLLRENQAIVDVARVQWEKERLPVPEEWKKQLVR
jgi:2-polyprenyl-6-methoxyphenol hydroxylase-like FAD-dependent oxidoreductase